jgi:hypothetical protein
MTYIAYTLCDNGFRFFADLSGVCVSYDQKLIKGIIAERGETIKAQQEHTKAMERQLEEAKAQGPVPPIIDTIMIHNRRVVQEQVVEHKRTSVAEAAVNDQLVRGIMYFDDINDAIAYTKGQHESNF